MNEPTAPTSAQPQDAIPPYLGQIADLLQHQMPDAWNWAASDELANEDADTIRLELLRSCLRLDRQAHSDLYGLADTAAATLNLDLPVTIYQQQNPTGWNAAAVLLSDAAHIVLHGPLGKELSAPELTAVLAHEMAHVLLWKIDSGKHAINYRLLDALSNDPSAAGSHLESMRLVKLYTEVFCDRMAYTVVSDSHVVISSLLKIDTQSIEIDSASYLKQADEILSEDNQASQQTSHPEMYIRAKAIAAWAEQSKDDETDVEQIVQQMIQNQPRLESLDLVAQFDLTGLTWRVLDAIFRHHWLRTESALSHARLFFDDYKPAYVSSEDLDQLAIEIAASTTSIRQYIGYLLLDFSTTEREHEDIPLAVSLDLAERFSISESFQELAKKELRMRAKQVRDLNNSKVDVLAMAGEGKQG